MKAVVRSFLILLLVVVSWTSVSAQSTPQADEATLKPFGNGIGSTAAYLDERGSAVISISVTGIERNWQGYDSYSEPQAGKDYVFVSMTVTNLTGRVYILEPYDFNLVDSLGISSDRAWVSRDTRVMSEDTTINGGQTLEVGMVFEMFSDLEPLMLMYQPDYDIFVVIYIGE